MGLLDFVVDIVEAAASVPVAIVYDTLTMGGALDDRDEPMMVSVAKKIKKAAEDLVDE